MVWFSWVGWGWLVGCCVSPCLPPRTDAHTTTSTQPNATGGGLGGARAGHRGEPGRRRHRHLGAWRGRGRRGNAMHICCRKWWMWLLHIHAHAHMQTDRRRHPILSPTNHPHPPNASPTNQQNTHNQKTQTQRFFPDEAREKYIAPTLRALFLTPHQVYRERDKRRKEGGGRRLLFIFFGGGLLLGAVYPPLFKTTTGAITTFIHSPRRSPPPLQHQSTPINPGRRPRGGRRRGRALRRREGPR